MKALDRIGMRNILFAVISVALFLSMDIAFGHESQPGAVEIRELGPDRYEVIWRAPLYYNRPHPARLELPEAWEIIGQPVERARPDSIVYQQRISTGGKSLDGAVIRFPGLESTITDVFIRVMRADGSTMTAVARPTRPWAELRGERPWYQTAREYLLLGLHHILMGIDHLLFVLGLLLIVQQRLALIKTITSFTIAHSITLGVATLGYAHIPLPPLNTAIALSILFLGPEIIRVQKGKTSLTIQYPWLIAFGFGLLHGFGFASGLSTAGMPKAELPWALLWFNIGVELGQILFVFLALGLTWSFRILQVHWPRWALKVPGYTVGSLGAYWTIQRTFMMIGGL